MIHVHSIDLCGFRGCRERLQIEFGRGFTILSGLNGSGKSTVLDAIEFALTGAISKYQDTTGEKGEKATDYEWWRGEAQPVDRYVRVTLLQSNGDPISIERRPGSVDIQGKETLLNLLCDLSLNPEATLAELCRTSFIRDEFIASQSVDLPETDRFAFVRAAVGAQNTLHIQAKLQKARDEVQKRLSVAERDYAVARSRVEEAIERLSSSRSAALSNRVTPDIERSARRSVGLSDTATAEELLRASDKELSIVRTQLDALSQFLSRSLALEARLASGSFEERKARKSQLEGEASVLRQSLERNQQLIADSETEYLRLKDGQELTANLAEIVKAGRQIGLRDGACPLCGQPVAPDAFDQHIREIETEVTRYGTSVTAAIERRNELRSIESVTRKQLDTTEHELFSISAELESLERQIFQLTEEIKAAYPKLSAMHSAEIQAEAVEVSKRLSSLDQERRATAIPLLTRDIQSQEADLKRKRDAAAEAEERLSALRRVDDQIKEGLDTMKRFSAEVVEDRLAAIKPLFTELYHRLRPHIDWKTVDYAVRGDLRRFLSLRVDHGLNMKFLFSSGQRRAAGLAFLISVALSRPWCRLRTLVLDDPIQHVDDFRAVHLVETLAAIRGSGLQILCAVEDPNLAELLCRRLKSKFNEPGLLVEMKYMPGSGTQISSTQVIPPLGIALLAAAS